MTLRQQIAARNRKPLPPAAGRARWLLELTTGPLAHAGLLEIEVERGGKQLCDRYLVERIIHGTALAGYSLRKLTGKDAGKTYHIDIHDPHGWRCSCADATYRAERECSCKHSRALQAALQTLGIDIPETPQSAA